jgi:uncharacterized ion transporter superfamily protein YfcC
VCEFILEFLSYIYIYIYIKKKKKKKKKNKQKKTKHYMLKQKKENTKLNDREASGRKNENYKQLNQRKD